MVFKKPLISLIFNLILQCAQGLFRALLIAFEDTIIELI